MSVRSPVDIRKVLVIFRRELRDQLRDRRTLFMVMVLPVLLYPALGIGMLQMAVIFSEKPRTVVVLGAESLPQPRLIAENGFAPRWFTNPADAARLTVETRALSQDDPAIGSRLEVAARVHQLYRKRLQILGSPPSPGSKPPDTEHLQEINETINVTLREAGIDVLVVIPQDFASNLREIDRQIATRTTTPEDPSEYCRPLILVSGDEKSLIASRRVQRVFEVWEQALLRLRLEAAGLPRSLPSPVDATVVKVASGNQESALVWSKLYPVILVLMTVTGAFYPAVDLAAGEKERGTMETLLISPARRIELVLAKFFTILVFSLATAVLNLVSLGLTASYMVGLAGPNPAAPGTGFAPPPTGGLLWILVMLVPLAALFSGLCLALATFAKSTREGQYYLTPLMIVTSILVAMAASPGIELQPFHVVLPIIGPALLLKQLLIDPTRTETLLYLAPVLAASFAYAGLALWWAVAQFHSEQVLFREAERLDLRLWLKRLWTNKPAVPGPGGAFCCLSIALLGQLLLMRPVGHWLASLSDADRPGAAIWLLIGQQVLLFLLPALLMGGTLLTDARRTFRLRSAPMATIAVAVALALALHPLVQELMQHLQWFFPPGLPEGSQEFLQQLLGPSQPVWLILLAIAVTPAVCEEVLFRGYVLSSLDRPGRHRLAIVLSSMAFGAIHMIPQQVFYTTLIGLVLGSLALRTGSLWPCLAFHATFNAIAVLRERLTLPAELSGAVDSVLSIDSEGSLRYDWPLLATATVVLVLLLRAIRSWKPPA